MPRFLFLVFLALTQVRPALAENMPRNDQEFFQMMRAKAEQAQMEEEFKNPKKPVIGKGRAVRGNPKAQILVFEYSDFQCPYCKKGWETAEELKKKYKGKMALVFKHLPLPFHVMAMPTAKRFEAIAMQSADKAYAFHDAVFKDQEKLSVFREQSQVADGEKYLDEVAKKVKANVAKMKTDMESETVKKNIEADMEEAKNFGIQGTPGFVVMGVTLKGAYPIDSFNSIIEKRLAEKK